ncbi:structural protein [Acidovorax phage AP1]|nr:structural protein [Acidovorax phage AP1]
MATESDNITITFAREIMDHVEALVDEKSAEASTWAQETIAATNERADPVDAMQVLSGGGSGSVIAKPILPSRPALPARPTIGTVSAAPLLRRPPDLPATPVLPTVPDVGGLDAGSMVGEFKTVSGDLLEELKRSLDEFAAKWFPQGQYLEKATAWLERALSGGATVNAQVESQLWERDRARLTAEANRAADEALTTWASRGYALPPGALAHQVLSVRQGLTAQLSAQSRDIAIKAHQDEIDAAKFAVQQATNLRATAMSAAINFIQALTTSATQALQLTTSKADALARIASAKATIFGAEVDAKAKLFTSVAGANAEHYKAETGAQTDVYRAEVEGFRAETGAEVELYRSVTSAEVDAYRTLSAALTDLYRAESSAADLDLRARISNAQLDLEAQRANQAAQLSQLQARVQAFVANANQIASQCAAAIQGLRMGASVGNSSQTTFQYRQQ